jgi:hypothetical protein
MARLIISLLFFAITSPAIGQVVEQKIQEQIASLKSLKIDTFIIYSFTCNGGLIPLDTCAYEDDQYLVWQQNTKTFLRRFNYCKDFKTIQIDTTNPLTFYFKNKRVIDKEKIKPPTYIEVRKTTKGLDTIANSVTVSHSCFHQFDFITNGRTIHKSISTFDLDYKKFDNGKRNVYYNYNRQTYTKRLIDLMTKQLEQINNTENLKLE